MKSEEYAGLPGCARLFHKTLYIQYEYMYANYTFYDVNPQN